MPAPRGGGPFRVTRTCGPWSIEVRSIVGARPRLEDAWVAHQLEWRGQPFAAMAVLDGVGGLPKGREAAWAVADAVSSVVAKADGFDDVLPSLERVAAATGGATTAIMAMSPLNRPGDVAVASVGDSAAYLLNAGGRLRRVNPLDVGADGHLTDCLGAGTLRGHVFGLDLAPGAALLLASDGVEVAGRDIIEATLAAPPGAQEAALDLLCEAVAAAGAPDNATALLARRE